MAENCKLFYIKPTWLRPAHWASSAGFHGTLRLNCFGSGNWNHWGAAALVWEAEECVHVCCTRIFFSRHWLWYCMQENIPYPLSISYLHVQSTRREQRRCKVRHGEPSGCTQTHKASLLWFEACLLWGQKPCISISGQLAEQMSQMSISM